MEQTEKGQTDRQAYRQRNNTTGLGLSNMSGTDRKKDRQTDRHTVREITRQV